jgi:hypothetical protein
MRTSFSQVTDMKFLKKVKYEFPFLLFNMMCILFIPMALAALTSFDPYHRRRIPDEIATLSERTVLKLPLTEFQQLVLDGWLRKNVGCRHYFGLLLTRVDFLKGNIPFIDGTFSGKMSKTIEANGSHFLWAGTRLCQAVQCGKLEPLVFSIVTQTEYVFIKSLPNDELELQEKKVSESSLRVFRFDTKCAVLSKEHKNDLLVAKPAHSNFISIQMVQALSDSPIDAPLVSKEDRSLVQKYILGSVNQEESIDHLRALSSNPEYRRIFALIKARIHTFSDGAVRLIDGTEGAIAKIVCDTDLRDEFISLNGFKIARHATSSELIYPRYSRAFSGIDFISVRDLKETPGWVVIETYKLVPNSNTSELASIRYVQMTELVNKWFDSPSHSQKKVCYEAVKSPPKIDPL